MIAHFNKYLAKQVKRTVLIPDPPDALLKMVIILPVYNEPNLKETLQSIQECKLPNCKVEVIILINNTEDSTEDIKNQNLITLEDTQEWAKQFCDTNINYYTVYVPTMPKKHAGVGLARKLAMDEAIYRFNTINESNGIICSLDADTLVSPNYLVDIENAFRANKKLNLVIPWFEHRLNGNKALDHAICEYELHLRYFKLAIKHTGFPFAYHTIGSAFAVSAEAYVKQGGMNKKQGGEDFYFLQKIFQLDGTRELNQVKVYPSNRPSDRVPFGTGPAIQKIIIEGTFETYQFCYFDYLKAFFANVPTLHNATTPTISDFYNQLHNSLQAFINADEFQKRILELQNNSSSEKAFTQRFYRWFDAFKIIKYLNFVHLNKNRVPVTNAVVTYLNSLSASYDQHLDSHELLKTLKAIETTT